MSLIAFALLEAVLLVTSAVLLSVGAYQARQENAARRAEMVAWLLAHDPLTGDGWVL